MRDKDELRAELKGIQKALDEAKAEYDEGAIDTGRYLKLKKKYEADKEKLEQELKLQGEPESQPGETVPVNQNIKLDNEQRRELIDLLSKHPSLATHEGRDVWLCNLPRNVQNMITRRSDHCKNDLTFIVEAIRFTQMADGRSPLLILIDVLLSEMLPPQLELDLQILLEGMIVEDSPTKIRGNPFTSRMPVRGKFFFGRDTLIKRIFRRIEAGESVSLVGEGRSGKTSILLRLLDLKTQYLSQPDQHVFVFEDLLGLDYQSEVDIWLVLLQTLLGEICHTDLENTVSEAIEQLQSGAPVFQTLRYLFRTLSGSGFKVTFLLDEFEYTAHDQDLVDLDFYQVMRNLASDHRTELTYVIATRQELSTVEKSFEERFNPLSSPLFNIFHSFCVPVFFKKEAEQMVKELLEDVGASKRTQNAFWSQADFLFQLSGYHPFFLQVACHHLFEHAILPDGTFSKQIAQNDIKDALFSDVSGHLDHYWYISSEQERSLIRQLASGSGDINMLPHKAALRSLRDRCLVVKGSKSEWQLFSVVFVEWVQSKEGYVEPSVQNKVDFLEPKVQLDVSDKIGLEVLRVLDQARKTQPGTDVNSELVRGRLGLSRKQMLDVILALEENAFIKARFVDDIALLKITADGVTILQL